MFIHRSLLDSAEVCDSLDGADPGADAPPVAVPAVLSGPQVVHPALVVGLVVQEPVAVHHAAGVEVSHAELVLDVGAVVHQLVHLAGHVEALVEPQPVGAVMLVPHRIPLVSHHNSNRTRAVLQAYLGDHTAGPDAVVDADHSLVVRVLSSPQVVLVPRVVGPLVHHKAAALHPDGVAPVEVGMKVGAVTAALVGAPLEVLVFVEYDLWGQVGHSDRKGDEGALKAEPGSSGSLPFPSRRRRQVVQLLPLSRGADIYKKRKNETLFDCTA